MKLSKIRLELARTKEHPEGERLIGYEFMAPLDADAKIDAEEWRKLRDHCRVRRFHTDRDDEMGHLLRRPGGSWAFHYDVHGEPANDDAGFKFGEHQFRAGEYVTIREDEGLQTYRVVYVGS